MRNVGDRSGVEARRNVVNAWVRSLPDYVDVSAVLGETTLLPEYAGDGLHWSEAGHRRVGVAVAQWFASLPDDPTSAP